MNNPKWGTKRQCQECGARFYDLGRPKTVCPKCDAPFKAEAQPKAKRAIATPDKVAAPAPPLVEAVAKPEAAAESAEDKAIKEFNVDIPDAAGVEDDEKEDKDENAFEELSEVNEDDMAEVIDGSRKVDES